MIFERSTHKNRANNFLCKEKDFKSEDQNWSKLFQTEIVNNGSKSMARCALLSVVSDKDNWQSDKHWLWWQDTKTTDTDSRDSRQERSREKQLPHVQAWVKGDCSDEVLKIFPKGGYGTPCFEKEGRARDLFMSTLNDIIKILFTIIISLTYLLIVYGLRTRICLLLRNRWINKIISDFTIKFLKSCLDSPLFIKNY